MHMYSVKALLPGCSTRENYILIATSEFDVIQKFNQKFPGCKIRGITQLNDNEIIEAQAKPAHCPTYGYGTGQLLTTEVTSLQLSSGITFLV